MLVTPSLSPSPKDFPSTILPPLLQPRPVVQVQPPLAAPIVSPPSGTIDSSSPVASPPVPPLLTRPLGPISTPAATPPSVLPVTSPPPAAIAVSPVITPQPPTPPVVASPPIPPAATTISPIASPPYPAPPALVIPSPSLPESLAPPPQPSKPLPSIAPLPSPTPPTPPFVILPPPATIAPPLPPPIPIDPQPTTSKRPPIDPPPFTLVPPTPASPAASHSIGAPNTPGPPPPQRPPLTLTFGKGGLPSTKQRSHSPIGLIVACIGVGILLFVVFALVCIYCKGRRRKQNPLDTKTQLCLVTEDDLFAASIQRKQEKVAPPEDHVIKLPSEALPPSPLTNAMGCGSNNNCIFTYEELAVATDGFSESNLLGQGGFGYVYKGLLPSGQEVAVKKLKAGSQQGEREFQAEVETISRVHHKHLVSLLGYCMTGAERLLVYEFVPNKTLEFHLHENGQPVIAWESRLKIAIGSAKGIAYLHEDCSPTIIHRDIKASNILLDPRFEAKVSDFGLAKMFFDASSSITHISTRVVGTFGYLAPEYALTGKLTDKSDVYSYGVMLLELITGRPPIIKQESSINRSLIDCSRPLLARALEDYDFDTLADPRLHGAYNKSEMASMVRCAAACVRQSAWLRPRMIQVVRALEGHISFSYFDEGTRSWNSTTYSSLETSTQNARQHKNHGFTGYSATTSEYGLNLNPSGSSSESQRTED